MCLVSNEDGIGIIKRRSVQDVLLALLRGHGHEVVNRESRDADGVPPEIFNTNIRVDLRRHQVV
jgi:hypothetical protein